MATQYEKVFIQHLTMDASMKFITEMDLPPNALPTADLQAIHKFAIDYWFESGATTAPTGAALKVHFANTLAEHEVDPDLDPEDTIEWAVSALQAAHYDRQWQVWIKKAVETMGAATLLDKPEALSLSLDGLMELQLSFSRKSERIDVREGIERRFEAYLERSTNRDRANEGIILGLDGPDEHTSRIWPGELAVFAGGPKSGKSYGLAWSALHYWHAGGTPVLMTLENDNPMTLDRMACMWFHLDPREFQQGRLSEENTQRVREAVAHMASSERPLWVIQPEPGKRTVEAMVREAKTRGDALFIDQLTFMDHTSRSDRSPRNIQVRDMLHDLKAAISTGKRLPCLLAHQINREGVKAMEKAGRLEMYFMAEAAEVERTADWVFGLMTSDSLRESGRAYLQLLAARRADLLDWDMIWRPWMGQVLVRGPVNLRESA